MRAAQVPSAAALLATRSTRNAVAAVSHTWLLDTGRRSDRYGRTRKGVLHLQEDGPLEPELYRLAMRSRLFLPLGRRVLRTGGSPQPS